MISKNSISSAMSVDTAISAEMASAISEWSAMYLNNADWIAGDVVSVGLPAAIASEISRSATIEMAVEVSGSARAEFLNGEMEKVVPALREQLEFACAKGGLVIKPYIGDGCISFDYVQADMFYPVGFDSSSRMTACVFGDVRKDGSTYYTRLESHELDGSNYYIRNKAFRSSTEDTLGKEISLQEVPEWANLQPEATITKVKQPLFAYIKYPLPNNIDPESPLGVSCYGRSVNLIKQADKLWSDFIWEFDSAKRALYVDELALGQDKNGKPVLPTQRLFRFLRRGNSAIGDEDLFEEWSPEIRVEQFLQGFNALLKRVEFQCGLAYGALSDPSYVAKTATEIQTSKQRSAATIRDLQKELEQSLSTLTYAMDVWTTIGKLSPQGTYEISFSFDDSLIVDADSQRSNDRQTVGLGAMSKKRYLVRNYKIPEEEADAWIEEAKADSAGLDPFSNL